LWSTQKGQAVEDGGAVFKLVSLYTWPDDVSEFDRRFRSKHLPALQALPGLQRLAISYFTDTPLGEPPYYAMTEIWFASREDLEYAMATHQAKEAQSALSFARGIATTLFATEEVLDV
jgi:uncharacterized protein (TIGR02118 family)